MYIWIENTAVQYMKEHKYTIEKIKMPWFALLYFCIAIFCWYYIPNYDIMSSSIDSHKTESISSTNIPQLNKQKKLTDDKKNQEQKKLSQKQKKGKKSSQNNKKNHSEKKLSQNNFIEHELESLFNNQEENEWNAQGFTNKDAEASNASQKIAKNHYQFQQKMNKFIEQMPINQNQQKKLHNYFLLVPPYQTKK